VLTFVHGTGNGFDEEDTIELRGLLYGLYAVLRLHTAQEDESYLSLNEEGISQEHHADQAL